MRPDRPRGLGASPAGGQWGDAPDAVVYGDELQYEQQQQPYLTPVEHDGGDDLPPEMVMDQTSEVRGALSLVRHNRLAKVQALLDDGFEVETRDGFGNSLLLVAAQNNLRRMAKLLLEQGADVNGRNGKGNTCLHFAYAYQFPKMIALLEAHGANEDATNRLGLRTTQGIDVDKGRGKYLM